MVSKQRRLWVGRGGVAVASLLLLMGGFLLSFSDVLAQEKTPFFHWKSLQRGVTYATIPFQRLGRLLHQKSRRHRLQRVRNANKRKRSASNHHFRDNDYQRTEPQAGISPRLCQKSRKALLRYRREKRRKALLRYRREKRRKARRYQRLKRLRRAVRKRRWSTVRHVRNANKRRSKLGIQRPRVLSPKARTYRAETVSSPKTTVDWEARYPGVLHVVRVLPSRVKFRFLLVSEPGHRRQPISSWVLRSRLLLATNLGMFQEDQRTHLGYLKQRGKVLRRRWVRSHLSAFSFDPIRRGLPTATLVDVDVPGAKKRMRLYRNVVQNLRLIRAHKGRGVSVWKKSKRAWSESALALDKKGRLLFLFSSHPYTMTELTRLWLAAPLGILRAMHLDGGSHAGLSFNSPKKQLHLRGGMGFFVRSIPNVLGILKR